MAGAGVDRSKPGSGTEESRDRRRPRQAGFTLAEVSVTTLLLAVVLGATLSTLSTSRKASKHTLSQIAVEEKVTDLLHRMVNEIRWASRDGEDINKNNTLDPGEDKNGNGRLEDDWLVGSSAIRFNARRPDGYAMPVTFRLVGDRVERVAMVDPTGREQVAVLVSGVTKFTITDREGTIRIAVAVEISSPDGQTVTREDGVSVTPRN